MTLAKVIDIAYHVFVVLALAHILWDLPRLKK